MIVGYARISTPEQKFDLQLDALNKAGCEKIFQDVGTGTKFERKGLQEALEFLREGDTLVVWKLDRLGRTLMGLIDFVDLLKQKKIDFKSCFESIDTTTPTGQFFFHITASFAELERNLIAERTRAGLAAARLQGKKGGRPRVIKDTQLKILMSMTEQLGMTIDSACSELGVNKWTFLRNRKAYLQRTINQL